MPCWLRETGNIDAARRGEERAMTNEDARLTELLDREAIRDCLYRYCRGIDRCDEAALRSSYWPDATDRHGAYQGPANGFIDAAIAKLSKGGRNVHMVGNIAIQ